MVEVTNRDTKEQFLLALNSNAYLNMCTADDMINVINALEKQIPKKPFKLKDTLLRDAGWIYGCPTCKCACGENKYHYEVTVDDAYCTQCGQALDWE